MISATVDKWDLRFAAMAEMIAGWSKDPLHGVGAVVVSADRRCFSVGYNGFPRGIEDATARLEDHAIKNSLTLHAEENAVLNARCSVAGWTMYVPRPPCLHCALVIVQAGIRRLVTNTVCRSSRWSDEQYYAFGIMKEAGMELVYADGIYERGT